MATWKELVDVSSTQTLTNKTLTTAVLGDSTANTQSASDNSTKVATTAYADAQAAMGDKTLANKKIWVGGSLGQKAEVDISGDITMTNAGVVAIGAEKVSYAKMQHVATANRVLGSTSADADVAEVQVATDMIADDAVTAAKLGHDLALVGDVSISGDLTVSGATITTSTETLEIADNTLILNSDKSGSADVDAGIIIERGSDGDNALFYWDEGKDKWAVGTNDNADLTTSATYKGDVMQVEISGAYSSSSSSVPIGHLQYHNGTLYLRVED